MGYLEIGLVKALLNNIILIQIQRLEMATLLISLVEYKS